MEELIFNATGFCEVGAYSSELQTRGGASQTWMNIFEKIRNVIDFIGDYIPKLIQGFTDGFLGVKLFG